MARERGRHNAFPHKSLLASAKAGPVKTPPRERGKSSHKSAPAWEIKQAFQRPRARRIDQRGGRALARECKQMCLSVRMGARRTS